ncbi:MAG: head GIN domain-containing protein [Pyrinomonadaceae bacterium]
MNKIAIIIFVAALLLSVFVSSFFSFGKLSERAFTFSFNRGVKGSGNVATETREVGSFSGVEVSGVFQVEITAQKEFGIEIEADDNLLPLIKTELRNGVLRIETEQKIKTSNPLKVRISAPNIDSIEASGASKVSLADLKNSELRIDTSGASKINISGETAELTVEVSGASSIDAENLRAVNASVGASGASRVSVFASNELKSSASGASKIVYLGSPRNIEKSSSGASSVREK